MQWGCEMGSIIGGIAGAIFGGRAQRRAAETAASASAAASESALTGFRFLQDNQNVNQAQEQGTQAGGLLSALLGLGGDQQAADQAFQQFQDSTGFQFRVNQGLEAINQNSAASGLLNSGSTLKALNQFGQNSASAEFQNFLGELSGVQAQGLNAAQTVGSAGSTAGANAGGFIAQAGQQRGQGILGASNEIASGLGSAFGGLFNTPSTLIPQGSVIGNLLSNLRT